MAEEKFVTEAAMKLAEEFEVNLDQIEGTGKDGNVTVEDVRKAAEGDGPDTTEDRKKPSVLNPRLEIGSYTFEDGKTFASGRPVPLTDAEHEKYSQEKYRGFQVVVRA